MAQIVLDGAVVVVGDRLFDITSGHTGVVQGFTPQEEIILKLPNNAIRYFNSDGSNRCINKALYWHNPIVIVPPKSGAIFSKLQKIAAILLGAD